MNIPKDSPGAKVAAPAAESGGSHRRQLEAALALGLAKARRNIQRLADHPKSAAWAVDGNYFNHPEGFYEIGNWTSSFFTGQALLAGRETADEDYLTQVLRLAPHYREKAFVRWLDTHHDLGFLYSLFSVALYRLTGAAEHREVGVQAAKVLANRFNAKGNFIRAWGHMNTDEHANMAIIDCLMNLPLLYWASRETHHAEFREIAIRHADMALEHFIRPDDSVVHAFRFDLASGKPLGPDNYCGFSKDSHWARGTAWAIYGFALSHGHTQDRKYLDAAVRVARKFVRELDDEVVPVWDFRLPADRPRVRDASAAAVAVCGLQELAKHQAADVELLEAKKRLLERICRADYLDFREECPGVLKFGYGDKPAYSSWGDYFLMEALCRELRGGETFWH